MVEVEPRDREARKLPAPAEGMMIAHNLSPAEVTRYSQQIALSDWGREAQEKLKASRVLLAGASGLGSAIALHLLATGVGALRLVDHSRVSLADLYATILYRERDLGKNKSTVAERRLKELNPFVLVRAREKPFQSTMSIAWLPAATSSSTPCRDSPAGIFSIWRQCDTGCP